jgi:hypothetical protein
MSLISGTSFVSARVRAGVISAATVVSGQAHRLSESHAAKNGFTQYRRAGKGVYEKTAGKGPGIIRGD